MRGLRLGGRFYRGRNGDRGLLMVVGRLLEVEGESVEGVRQVRVLRVGRASGWVGRLRGQR